MTRPSSTSRSLLLTPSALAARLADGPENIRILDATWFMPSPEPRNPEQEFLAGPRIRGATGFWSVDEIAEKHHLGLGHMMPGPERFAQACSRMGIKRDSEVVVYDTHGVFSSPRTAFTFKAFGHKHVSVLNGGLPRWIAEGHPVEKGEFKQPYTQTEYPVSPLDEDVIRSYEQITANAERDASDTSLELVLDARPSGRFTGEAPEPRPGLSSGHMPNSISLPFNNLRSAPSSTTPSYQTLLSESEELKAALLKALGGDEGRLSDVLEGKVKVVNSCGSGMTAAVIWLALQELGINSSIYDESWTGYASRQESKIIKGQ